MNTVLENVNEIIQVKNELKNILIAVGMNPTDDFDSYSDLFRTALNLEVNIVDDILG